MTQAVINTNSVEQSTKLYSTTYDESRNTTACPNHRTIIPLTYFLATPIGVILGGGVGPDPFGVGTDPQFASLIKSEILRSKRVM